MSRKSLPKKETAIWYLCNSCNCHILAKDRDQHLCSNSEIAQSTLVRNKKLYANQLTTKTITEDLREIDSNKLNNLIFLNETIFSLCDLVLGDYVLITSCNLPNEVSIVRSVWPVLNQNPLNGFVSVTEEELNTTWKDVSNTNITIEKISNDIVPASSISMQPLDSEAVDRNVWTDIRKVLMTQMRGNIYRPNNQITVNFFNKNFTFIIKEIRSDAKVDDNLINQFQSMNLTTDTNCFLFTTATNLNFFESTTKVDDDKTSKQPSKLSCIGGFSEIIDQLTENMYIAIGDLKTVANCFIPRSVLLIGQHGSGKTLMCDAITEKSDALIMKITATEIFSKFFGETESKLLSYFEKAYKNYPKRTVIIIEEVSSICPKETKEESTKRVQMTFLNILDEIHKREDASRLFLLATTSCIDNVHLAIRRFGRLDVEIEIPVPDPLAREQILLKQLQFVKHNLSENDVKMIANNSHGFIASDLSNLVAKATLHALKKHREDILYYARNPITTTRLRDFQYSFNHVVPSAMKEVVIKSPNVKWSDIGGQDELKLQLKQAIEWPLHHPEVFTRLGISCPRGILMFGPPGCSKTMIAKALATESKVNFLSIKGPELFSMWVGESERAVRDLFHKARQVAPSIIFFDEIDAIGSERSSSASGSSVKERVLTQLLTEMDGVNALKNVTIVAATNRPDLIDKAIMRPGRLDRIVYVRLPDSKTRYEIFRIKLSKMPVSNDVDIDALVEKTNGYSGAEIQAICQEAAIYALEENFNVETIEWKYFVKAINNVAPRTSAELLKIYDDYLNESSLKA